MNGKEVFLNCVALQEVVIPTELSDIGNRGCPLSAVMSVSCGTEHRVHHGVAQNGVRSEECAG